MWPWDPAQPHNDPTQAADYGSEAPPAAAPTPMDPVDPAGEAGPTGPTAQPKADMSNVYWKQIQRLQAEVANPGTDPARKANAQKRLEQYQLEGQTSPEYMRRRQYELEGLGPEMGGASPEAIEAWKQRRDLFTSGEDINAFNPGASQAAKLRYGPPSNIQAQIDAITARGGQIDPNSNLAKNIAQQKMEAERMQRESAAQEEAQTPPGPSPVAPQERMAPPGDLAGAGDGLMGGPPEGPSPDELAGAGDGIISPPGGMQRASLPAGGPKAPDMPMDRVSSLPPGDYDLPGQGLPPLGQLPPSDLDLMGPDETPRPPRRQSPRPPVTAPPTI